MQELKPNAIDPKIKKLIQEMKEIREDADYKTIPFMVRLQSLDDKVTYLIENIKEVTKAEIKEEFKRRDVKRRDLIKKISPVIGLVLSAVLNIIQFV